MKVVIQRVSHTSCTVDGEIIGQIQDGLLLLVGFNREDDASVLPKMIRKIVNMRIFGDEEGKLNRSVLDIKGEVLSISQFTLYASCKKGNRPSFIEAAPAEQARMLYDQFNALLEQEVPVQKGVFQADMKIDLLNDGPITIVPDSREV